ncbi:hypothetical protein KY289_004147 [Solanum tuberosum]|nr:hypothetical protein KY289_004147 [Solanum tuberosum]
MDMSCFLKEVGLDHDDVPVHLGASTRALELSMKSKSLTYQPESPTKHYVQVEELPELIFYDQVRCISFSPCAASPKSVRPRYIRWPDDSVLNFALIWNTYPFKELMDTTFNSRITRSPLKYIRCSHCSVGGEDIKFSVMEPSGQFCFHATHFYGLKEHVLAICLIDALSMSGDSDDAHHLLNWRKGGLKTASNSGNFSLVATELKIVQICCWSWSLYNILNCSTSFSWSANNNVVSSSSSSSQQGLPAVLAAAFAYGNKTFPSGDFFLQYLHFKGGGMMASSMKCNPAEATNLRGQLDLPYKLPTPVAVITFCVPRSLNAAITENFPSPFATQLRASLVGKNGISKKRGGGIGGRKALNDISKPAALHQRKHFSESLKRITISHCQKLKLEQPVGEMKSELCQSTENGNGQELFFQGSWIRYHDDVPVHLGASPHALELSMKSKSSTYQPESLTKYYVQVEELPELIFYDQIRSDAVVPMITAIHVPATCNMDISPSHSDGSLVSMDESMSTSDTVRTPEVEYIDDHELWTWNQGIKLSTLINYALQWACEEGEQGQLPVLVLSMKETDKKKRPAFVFIYSTNKCKEWLRPLL